MGRKTIPAWLVYGSILLALVLLVVAIWGFGGFKKRTDILKTTPPGTLITTGPYEFRFTEATAQHWTDYDGTVYWNVVMVGEGRTTGKESISPSYMPDSGMFVSKDDVTQQIPMPDRVQMGEGEGFDRRDFTPGLPLIPYSVVFKYDDRYQPGPTIRFVIWDVVYGKRYLASDEKAWKNGDLRLPVPPSGQGAAAQGPQVIKPPSKARCASSSNQRGGVSTGVRAAVEGSYSSMPISWSA